MSTRVWDMFSLPTKRRLTIVLLATHASINKSIILWIKPIIDYLSPKFPTSGVSSNEENKALLAVSRRMAHLYLPRCCGHLASQPQHSESIYISYILHMLCISTLGLQRHRTTDHSLTAKFMCAIIHVVHASNLPSVTVLGDLNKNWKSSHKTEAAPSNLEIPWAPQKDVNANTGNPMQMKNTPHYRVSCNDSAQV